MPLTKVLNLLLGRYFNVFFGVTNTQTQTIFG